MPQLRTDCLLDRCGGDVYELGHSDDPFWGQQLQITVKSACTPKQCSRSKKKMNPDGVVGGTSAFVTPLMDFKEKWMSINMKSKQIPLNAARWFECPMPVGHEMESALIYKGFSDAQAPVYLRRNIYKKPNSGFQSPIFAGHWFSKGQQIGRADRQKVARQKNGTAAAQLVFDVTRYNDPGVWSKAPGYFDARKLPLKEGREPEPSNKIPEQGDLEVASKLANAFGSTDSCLKKITEMAGQS